MSDGGNWESDRIAGRRRIKGYDVARSVAMLGMMIEHFVIVTSGQFANPNWVGSLLARIDGRATAIFIVLAGIGVTLMSQMAVVDGDALKARLIRRKLMVRGSFLLLLGHLNLVIWQGDILRIYGLFLFMAALMFRSSSRTLWATAAAQLALFSLGVIFLDFDKNWDWEALSYHHLWTAQGLIRNLIFDGFRSFLPWSGLFLLGMWLGRLDLSLRRVRMRVLITSVAIAVAVECLSHFLLAIALTHEWARLDAESMKAILGTESLPAMPLFFLAASATATALIAICVELTETLPGWQWEPPANMGQMALSWYLLHIVVGLGMLEAYGMVGNQSPSTGLICGLTFYAIAVVLSWLWRKWFDRGPVEWLMRSLDAATA